MRISVLNKKFATFTFLLLSALPPSHADTASPTLLQAKKEAEAKGYIFVATHDEIVSRAKKEGVLWVHTSMSGQTMKHLSDAFKKMYPFIDVRAVELKGTEVFLRVLTEIKAGLTKEKDIIDLVADYHDEYLAYQKKFDIRGMAEHKVLQIPAPMVDPVNRNIVAIGSGVQVVAYNKKRISAEKIPDAWEGFLDPDFRDKRFAVDIRPRALVALTAAWGLEKTLDFAQQLAAQKPVWVGGQSGTITAVLAGEHAVFFGANLSSLLRVKKKDLTDTLGYKLIEPVPVRLDETWSVLNTAEHPYSGLLWLEFASSPEGQKILDEYEPYVGSFFVTGTVMEQSIRGKKLSLFDWHYYGKTQEYQEKIVKALGFPRIDK